MHVIDSVFIGFNHAVKPIAFWRENITVQREAVVRSIGVGWDRGTKAEQRNLLVVVVVLQDVANTLDSLKILVPI